MNQKKLTVVQTVRGKRWFGRMMQMSTPDGILSPLFYTDKTTQGSDMALDMPHSATR